MIKQNVASYEVAAPLPLYLINRTLADPLKQDQAEGIAVYLRANDGWRHNDMPERQVRLELLRRLLQVLPKPVNPVDSKRIVDDMLTMHRITV